MRKPIIIPEAFKRVKDNLVIPDKISYRGTQYTIEPKDSLNTELIQEKLKTVQATNKKLELANDRFAEETLQIKAKTDSILIKNQKDEFDLIVQMLQYGTATVGAVLTVCSSSDIIVDYYDTVDVLNNLGSGDTDQNTSGITRERNNMVPDLAESDRTQLKPYLDKFLLLLNGSEK